MFLTPQNTTIGMKLPNKKLSDLLEVALVSNHLNSELIGKYPQVVALIDNGIEVESIPPFAHPVKVRDKIVIDIRTFRSKLDRSNNERALYEGPVGLQIKQAALQELWASDPSYLFDISDLPIKVYAHWMGEAISRRKDLSPVDNRTVVIASAWFYACQFIDWELERNGQLDDSRKYALINRISRVTYGSSEQVSEIVERMGNPTTLQEFVDALKGMGIIRLGDLNIGTVLTWIGNSWFGNTAAKEMVGIATEYPPYFVSMVHTAVTESTYRRTAFNDIALRNRRDDPIRRFDISLRATLETLKD